MIIGFSDLPPDYNEVIYCYIERFESESNAVLFDFLESNEYFKFIELANMPNNLTGPTMVYLKNYRLGNLQEGKYYKLKKDVLSEAITEGNIAESNESLVYGFILQLSDSQKEFFEGTIGFSTISNLAPEIQVRNNFSLIDASLKGKIEVKVKNVGQGSWNEIYENEGLKVVFDIGTSFHASKLDVNQKATEIEEEYLNYQPGLVISHWDVDHYHYLLALSDAALRRFRYILCRSQPVSTLSRVLLSRIKNTVSQNLISIGPFEKQKGTPFILINSILGIQSSFQCLLFYNACYHFDRNKSGISIVVRTRNSSVVLPGDSHYEQVSKWILPDVYFQSNNYLVVPHHGGKAGKFVYNLRNGAKPSEAIISVGKNTYGHPLNKYIDSLRKTGFKVKQTRITGSDIIITL